MKTKKKANIKTFEEHLDKQYGKSDSAKRTEFENRAKELAVRHVLKGMSNQIKRVL